MVEDLEQEGAVGLLEAIDKWDPQGGAALPTYAINGIWGRMMNHLRYEKRNQSGRMADAELLLVDEYAEDPEAIAVSRTTSEWLRTQREGWSEREQQVAECRYWIGLNNKETAAYLGISHGRVSQLERAIKNRLHDLI